MNWIKSQDQLLNTILFPGRLANSSYSFETFKNNYDLKLLYIPFKEKLCTNLSYFYAAPSHIPVILAVNNRFSTNLFCIHFHGNACDIGQISICARLEATAYNAHYLLVEYPGYGICPGHPNEVVMNEVSKIVHDFVIHELQVHYSRIVIIGRSIGTGPACYLASHLEMRHMPPFALILQSPFVSIHAVASDLLGIISYCMLDRWPNHYYLVGNPETHPHIARCPVLFLHADHDQIIACHHSQILHEQRVLHQLPSELFIQQSTEHFKKGHNYFDYEKDVLIPSKTFLLKIDHQLKANAILNTPNITTTTPHTSPGIVVVVSQDHYSPFLTTPVDFLPSSILNNTANSHITTCYPTTNTTTTGSTPNSTTDDTVSSSSTHNTRERMLPNPAQDLILPNGTVNKQLVNKKRYDICIGWMCCPCMICLEGCVGCWGNLTYHTCALCMNNSTNGWFVYENYRPKSFQPGSLSELLFHNSAFITRVNENPTWSNTTSTSTTNTIKRRSSASGAATGKGNKGSRNSNGGVEVIHNPMLSSDDNSSKQSSKDSIGVSILQLQPAAVSSSSAIVIADDNDEDANTASTINYIPG